ncbi:MAG: ABC transporter ATP-binding protein [Nitrospinota bacterium]|nr:MAG: ABC transporter ATP-binding protein [Nitrospinota bacterium]
MENVVQLINVTKRYGNTIAVDHISLEVKRGEFFSLLGPSGCGKTTTLNMIGGFVEPTEGTILIEGKEMRNAPPYRRNINTVFQNYALFPHMTVAENIGFGLKMKKVPRAEIAKRVEEMLHLISLPGYGSRRPAQLSGGEQQRVALARALINQPAVLLLDEPLGSLDLKLRKQMQIELANIQQRVGITFIYVTHDQEEALTMSDRIAVMERGQIKQVGTPTEIYEHPRSKFVADFIGVSNFFEGTVVRVEEDNVAVVTTEDSLTIYVRIRERVTPDTSLCVAVRPESITLSPPHPSRERNTFPGMVRKVSYLGNHIEYLVELGNERSITVYQPRQADEEERRRFQVGEKVSISWLPDKGIVLRE